MDIILATILFIILSPGLIITIPNISESIFRSGYTNNIAVLVHAILFFTIQKLVYLNQFPFYFLNNISREISKNVREIPSLLSTLLFIILSPGFILTLPPTLSFKVFFSQETNILAIILHALLYFIILMSYYNGLSNPTINWFNNQIKTF
jgi:hypothetical protein